MPEESNMSYFVNTGNPQASNINRVIPFKITKEEAQKRLFKRLVEESDIPLDIFSHLHIESVEEYMIPMYVFNGKIEGTWSAALIKEHSRQVNRNGQRRTEYYNERLPIAGNINCSFGVMSSATNAPDLPLDLRNYIEAIDFSDIHASSILSSRDQYLSQTNIRKDIDCDREPMTVFRSQSFTNHLNSIANQVVTSQIPERYEDLRLAWNANGDLADTVLLAVYYITFIYKGRKYYYCIDGSGASEYINAPKDSNPAKKVKRLCVCKLIISVILSIVALWQGFNHSLIWSVSWILLPFLMMWITNQEWRTGLSNIRNLRESERRRFCKEQTGRVHSINIYKWVSNTLIITTSFILIAFVIGHNNISTVSSLDFKEDTIQYNEQLLWDAERGDVNAQLNMGRCYYFGNGVTQDYEKAFYWTKKSAEKGHYVAQHNLANMYYNGWGCEKNISLANQWMKRASDAGYAPSQYAYGMALANGMDGFVQDKETGASLIFEAAEKGFIPAKATLGHLYITSGDIEEGLHYTKSAAEENEPLAQYDLGMGYLHGSGLPKDFDKAIEYLQKSAQQDYTPAKDELLRIYTERRLSNEE